MAILYSGVQLELREVVLRQKPPQMLEVSPKATVPVLLLPDGQVIDESIDIVFWCLQQQDLEQWHIADPVLQRDAELLVAENDGEFKQQLDSYKYADRYVGEPADYRCQGELFLAKLEARLRQSRYLMGGKATFADVCIFPFIRQFAHVDKSWFYATSYTHLQQWLDGWLASALFNGVMHKYTPWRADDEPVIFPKR